METASLVRKLCQTSVLESVANEFYFCFRHFPSLWMKIKPWRGHDQDLKTLAKANTLGKKGKTDQAEPIYTRLHEHYPKHPGLLLNQSFGHLQAGNRQRAWRFLDSALRSCSNYGPAVRVMNQLQDEKPQPSQN